MGVYRAAIVTESGQNLIAQALANETPLIFTSAKTSSYSYPVGTNVPALTGLQDVVQSVMPFDSKVLGGNVAQVSVRFDNDGVDQTYRIETMRRLRVARRRCFLSPKRQLRTKCRCRAMSPRQRTYTIFSTRCRMHHRSRLP